MQRRVLLLHDYEGWSPGEIGGELGIAAGTSRYHVHAARKAMRGVLTESPAGPSEKESARMPDEESES